MKSFLLLFGALIVGNVVSAQPYNISSGTWNGTPFSDPPGYTITVVPGVTKRINGVRYEHNNHTFRVINKFITQANDPLFPDPAGQAGQNVDYFLYQGANEINGEMGAITFDTVYFNIGSGNIMNIINYNPGFVFDVPDPEDAFETPGYHPPGSMTISARLYFNNGITNTNRTQPVRGAIVFANSANYVGGLTDAQHVNGFVSEYNYLSLPLQPVGHGGDFTFPVGNASSVYQLRRQGTFAEEAVTLTVGWVDGDPDVIADPTNSLGVNPTTPAYLGAGINSVTKVGFWDWHIQPIDEESFNAQSLSNPQTITVSIPDYTGLPGLSAADLRLVGFNRATSKWEDLSGAPNATGLTKGSTLTGVIPAGVTITALAVGSTSTILPVDFISFTAKGDGCKVNLQWQTGMEQNNSHFIVERSNNGIQFNTIARVEAVGNSNTVQTYKFTDEAPVTGSTNYYRITQVDFDGKRTSSNVRSVRIQCDGSAVALRAYPNPVTSQVNVQTGKAVTQINLLNTNGQSVLKYAPSRNTGGTFSINMHAVQSGIYLLQLINKDGTTDVIKLVKQ